jgi:hypothetical protein
MQIIKTILLLSSSRAQAESRGENHSHAKFDFGLEPKYILNHCLVACALTSKKEHTCLITVTLAIFS